MSNEPPHVPFTIRDVLWLTVVVVLGVGWFTETRHIRYRNDIQTIQIRVLKGYAERNGFVVRLHDGGIDVNQQMP